MTDIATIRAETAPMLPAGTIVAMVRGSLMYFGPPAGLPPDLDVDMVYAAPDVFRAINEALEKGPARWRGA